MYKMSAFYFVIGKFENKYKSHLKDIYFCILSPVSFVNKYGYEISLKLLLDDLLKLETEGIKISFEGVDGMFCGSLSMFIADKHQVNENSPIENFILRTKEDYKNNLQSTEFDSSYSSLYGIKSDSCLHSFNFFHVTTGLSPDLANNLFEGFGVDLLTNAFVHLVQAQYLHLEQLIYMIKTFSYSTMEKTNKP